MTRKFNNYDNLHVDINELFDKHLEIPAKKKKVYFFKLASRYISALLIKINIYEVLIEIGAIKKWFLDFKAYWSEVLEGRPIYLHDFYFLLGLYRTRFQDVETPDYASNEDFLDSWQNANTIYMLFGAVRRFSRTPLISRRYERYIRNNDSVLEYGCGLAPITTSLVNVGLKRGLDHTIADIRQINFHYAIRNLGNLVSHFEIKPNLIQDLPKKYNVIIMITVMEHLPNPLDTVKNLTKFLHTGGIFIFDYHSDDDGADGQDTIEAIDQKKEVLDFIKQNYSLLQGKIDYEGSMGMTVVKKIL